MAGGESSSGGGLEGGLGGMDPEIAKFKVDGLAAATYTPIQSDGSVDLSVVEACARSLSSQGVRFAFINGTSGESMSLSRDERAALHAAWVEAGKKCDPPVEVIAHVGTSSTTETQWLARNAAESGCVAISVMPPTFFKPSSARALALWLREVAAAAPSLPLYLYHFPNITGVDMNLVDLFDAVAEVGVPSFRGTKNTCHDTHRYEMSVRYAGGRMDCLFGRDEAHLSGLVVGGAQGAVGNAFNYMAGAFHALRKAFAAADIKTAQRWQARINDFVHIVLKPEFNNGLVATKAVCQIATGIPLGPPRLPCLPLTKEQEEKLRAQLEKIGFFRWKDGEE